MRTNDHALYAYREPYNIPRPYYADPWVDALAQAWDAGVVTVFPTGNKPNSIGITNLGGATPQRYATSNNPMIVVGSIDRIGSKSDFTVRPGAPSGPPGFGGDTHLIGSISVYAHAQGIEIASSSSPSGYTTGIGTSYACPQIGGLAAYILGLPALSKPVYLRALPMAMKNYIVKNARDDVHDGVGTAYNGVRELPCSEGTSVTKKRRSKGGLKDEISLDGLEYSALGRNLTLLDMSKF